MAKKVVAIPESKEVEEGAILGIPVEERPIIARKITLEYVVIYDAEIPGEILHDDTLFTVVTDLTRSIAFNPKISVEVIENPKPEDYPTDVESAADQQAAVEGLITEWLKNN